ncbi:hypothetical protein FKW77_001299 [Venturia effusa]|uniref:Uncharacterized protein n=1 Tax=Venturia effusa TaxID=50376 RepID=A0A517LAC6_9PEZI|nr:hypothetical protein FKW77_001299 [Venturia effusa]
MKATYLAPLLLLVTTASTAAIGTNTHQLEARQKPGGRRGDDDDDPYTRPACLVF